MYTIQTAVKEDMKSSGVNWVSKHCWQ